MSNQGDYDYTFTVIGVDILLHQKEDKEQAAIEIAQKILKDYYNGYGCPAGFSVDHFVNDNHDIWLIAKYNDAFWKVLLQY